MYPSVRQLNLATPSAEDENESDNATLGSTNYPIDDDDESRARNGLRRNRACIVALTLLIILLSSVVIITLGWGVTTYLPLLLVLFCAIYFISNLIFIDMLD